MLCIDSINCTESVAEQDTSKSTVIRVDYYPRALSQGSRIYNLFHPTFDGILTLSAVSEHGSPA
jgi:hypothetical protein